MLALIAYIDNAEVTQELSEWFRIAFGSVFLWFVLGPVWQRIDPYYDLVPDVRDWLVFMEMRQSD